MQQRRSLPPVPIRTLLFGSISAAFLLMVMFPAVRSSTVFAAPGQTSADQALNQNVGYLGPEAAASLSLDFPVLVPSDVPAPFAGEPSVSASGNSYSLYWMNAGGAPTLLQITGEVGGSLPAGSINDLNQELTVNAAVQGSEAIHDLTVNYDAVWWIANDVLYKVESQNMAMGSLDLANSLVLYVGPETQAPVEEIPPEAGGGILESPTEVPDQPDEGTDSGADGGAEPIETSEATEEVDLPVEAAVQPTAQGDQPEAGLTVEPTTEPTVETEPVEAAEPTAEPEPGETVEPTPEPEPTAETQAGPTPEPTDEPARADPGRDTATVASNVGSDGTGGAPLPVFGGDGTGGTRDVIIQERDE